MILLDTHALLWVRKGHRRARPLVERAARLYSSPASLLELQVLIEVDRLRVRTNASATDLFVDDRWLMDDPPAGAWFNHAINLSWTRDPYDRLLAAHALLRGWKLATADEVILEHLPARNVLEL